MMSRLPLALRQTLLYGASVALMKGVSLLMLPFIAHQLTPEAYGRLEVIGSLAIIGSVLVGLGLEDALYRFAGAEPDAGRRRRLAGEIFGLALLTGALAWLAGWLAAERIAGLIPGQPTVYEVRLVLSLLALEALIAVPLGWLRMREKAIGFFLLTSGRALLQAALVLLFLALDRGVAGVLEAGLIAALIQALALSWLQLKDSGLSFSRATGSRALVYSLPIMASGLLAFALNGLDRWVLAEHASLTDVAHFGVAAKFALAVVLMLQPFGMWWSPRRFQVLHGPDGQRRAARFTTMGLSLTLILAVLVGLLSPILIAWLMPEDYALAGRYAMILVLAMAFKEMAELTNLGCFAGKTTRAQLLINLLGALIGVAAMLWWAQEHGVWGVILALLAAQGARLVLFFAVSQRLLPLPYPTRSLGLLGLAAGICLLLGFNADGSLQLIISMAGTGGLLVGALLLGLIPRPTVLTRGANA